MNIGNNVTIGAHSLVLSDIPDNAVAVGSPAKVIKINDEKYPFALRSGNGGRE